jgi:ribosomal protein L12E/L44/L45/RPP1/RPP2
VYCGSHESDRADGGRAKTDNKGKGKSTEEAEEDEEEEDDDDEDKSERYGDHDRGGDICPITD